MFLDPYHSIEADHFHISPEQASQFAKQIAGDYNPIHNPDARRFCVPGDLLFALVLWHFGLSQKMTFHFRSLLGKQVPVIIRERDDNTIEVCDTADKVYLEVEHSGKRSFDNSAIEEFIRCYVAASGKNFPHTLQPLMQQHGVMFNPDRPMVIYESMSLALDDMAIENPDLVLNQAHLEANGKRGNVLLAYHLTAEGKPVGEVKKQLIITGLRDYDDQAMDQVITEFYRLKEQY